MNTLRSEFEKLERKSLVLIGGKNNISDLLNFSVPEMTSQDLEAERKKAEERKVNAQTLADKIAKARVEVKKIEAIPDWDMNPDLVYRHQKLSVFLGKTETAGDEAFRSSLAVSGLINRIKTANPANDAEVEAELRNVAASGRGELISCKDPMPFTDIKKLPAGAIRFKNLCLLHKKSKIHPDKIASPADQSIFKELRWLVGRYLKTAKKDRIEYLKKKGDPNLADLKNKKQGIYRIHFPELKFKNESGDLVRWEEGTAIVELKNNGSKNRIFLVIGVVDGAGSLRWLADHKGEWVPWAAFLTGRVVEEKTPAEYLAFAKRFAKALNKALFIFMFKKGQKN